jgi:hypothetical protein
MLGTLVCSRELADFAACPFWLGGSFLSSDGVFVLVIAFAFSVSDLLFFFCCWAFFCYDAEKNTMNYISTLFQSLIPSLLQ